MTVETCILLLDAGAQNMWAHGIHREAGEMAVSGYSKTIPGAVSIGPPLSS